MVLSFFNSLGTDGTFGNQDSEKSSISAVGRAIVPVFVPMGIHEDNWPATVGIFTGVFAKEAVVGTLNTLYSGLSETGAGADGAGEAGYDFVGGLTEALMSIPANLAGLAAAIRPPGPERRSSPGHRRRQEVGTLHRLHGGTLPRPGRAFAYMLFVCFTTPCVAARAPWRAKLGAKWALSGAAWTFGLAYGSATSPIRPRPADHRVDFDT
jgi:ferrous iron transport protein B